MLIGFNAGHSTAIWLSSNPLTQVYSFDLFEAAYKPKLVKFLQERFPGRLHTYAGDSTKVVPATSIPTKCDVVHIDGRHSYWNVLVDFLNLLEKSRRDSIFVFDDQCDPNNCTASSLVPAQPTLATCDLVCPLLCHYCMHNTCSQGELSCIVRPPSLGRDLSCYGAAQ